jgi:5-methylcytosine-specific restriction endonuclease McrA
MFFKRNKSGVTKIVRDNYHKDKTRVDLKKVGLTIKDDWYTLKARVLKRDNYRCKQCGTKHGSDDPKRLGKKIWLDAHHIRELSKGGTTTMANLISLCRYCHLTRHSHHF